MFLVASEAQMSDLLDEGISLTTLNPPSPGVLKSDLMLFLDEPLNLELVDDVVRKINWYYTAFSRPVVRVYAPEQALRNNILQIVVLEGKLGDVRLEGSKDLRLLDKFKTQEGELIEQDRIEKDIDDMNRNPSREVEVIYEEGENQGETDVVLKVTEKPKFSFAWGYADSGGALTEDERTNAGINWFKPFGFDHIMLYNVSGNPRFNLLNAHSLAYMIPLSNGHTLTLSGNYAKSGAKFPDPTLDVDGLSWGGGLNYSIPLGTIDKYSHGVSMGANFSRSNNLLEFNQISISDTTTDTFEFVVGYNGTLTDDNGQTSLGVNLAYSPGGVTGHNTQEKLVASGAGSANYEYIKFNAGRVTVLPNRFLWNVSAKAQISTTKLPGGGKFGMGGSSDLIGYDEREVSGDQGYMLTTDLTTPPIVLSKFFNQNWKDQLFLKVFAGYGETRVKGIDANTLDPHTTLMSFGPGFRYNVGDHLNMKFDYGIQLKDSGQGLLTRRGYNHRGHFGVGLTF